MFTCPSCIRSARDSAENPANCKKTKCTLQKHHQTIFLLYMGNKYWVTKVLTTMECIAPILAQARSATESSTIMGM